MRHTVPVVVVTMVVAATIATGVPAAAPVAPTTVEPSDGAATMAIAGPPNTSQYLALPDGGAHRARFGNASLDFGAAVAMDTARFQESLAVSSTAVQFENAPNASAKTAVLRGATDDLSNRTAALRQYQLRTIRRFTAGELTAAATLRRFGVIDARAREIDASGARIRAIAGGFPVPGEISDRITDVRQRSQLLSTDLRADVRRALVGDADPTQHLVSTSTDGVVLAKINGGQFVREAYLDGYFREDGRNRFDNDLGAAYDFTTELYSWAYQNRVGSPGGEPLINSSVYQIDIPHRHGNVLTYLDGSIAEVFLERQEKWLSVLPVARTVTETNATADLSVRANMTHPTGPMDLAVRNPSTDDPVDARISIDGQFVGETGSDGRLWTIQPRETVRIEAATGDGRVATTVTNDLPER